MWAGLPAQAGPFGKKRAPPPEPDPPEEPAPVTLPPSPSPFGAPLPLDHGEVPRGLASTSAQACNGCHFGSHDAWADSRHATGWRSEAFQAAVAEAGTPACTTCHLPLRNQHDQSWTYDADRIDRPLFTKNSTWDATLSTEGVTCAACHVRDGIVLTGRALTLGETRAPHPLGWSADLARSEGCAFCHQLTWEGAAAPLYDTFGEWSRSPHAEVGIQCQDCHMGAGAAESRLGADHSFRSAEGRAVSVLIELPRPRLVRGDDPVQGTLRLQNTGAGHAWPTGSPYKGVRLTARLLGPGDKVVELLTTELARTLSSEPPWSVTADTRLQAGEERAFEIALALETDLPAGAWTLEVAAWRTIRGAPDAEPLLVRSLPLQVE